VSGRIGRAEVTEGACVQQAQATLMARVQQLEPLCVDVSESSVEVLRLWRELEAGRLRRSDATHATVKLFLEDGTECPDPGTLQLSDVTVEPSTGSLTPRMLVPNPGLRLLPGMFVRARPEEGVDPDALLVPQSAVTRDSRGRATALVVGAQNKVEPRVLVANRSVGDQWLATEGGRAGDQVISDVTLLSAQRDLYGAQQTLIDARLARLTNFVSLYKALGGGWWEHTRAEPANTQGEAPRRLVRRRAAHQPDCWRASGGAMLRDAEGPGAG